jgi:hypothetical protein
MLLTFFKIWFYGVMAALLNFSKLIPEPIGGSHQFICIKA